LLGALQTCLVEYANVKTIMSDVVGSKYMTWPTNFDVMDSGIPANFASIPKVDEIGR